MAAAWLTHCTGCDARRSPTLPLLLHATLHARTKPKHSTAGCSLPPHLSALHSASAPRRRCARGGALGAGCVSDGLDVANVRVNLGPLVYERSQRRGGGGDARRRSARLGLGIRFLCGRGGRRAAPSAAHSTLNALGSARPVEGDDGDGVRRVVNSPPLPPLQQPNTFGWPGRMVRAEQQCRTEPSRAKVSSRRGQGRVAGKSKSARVRAPRRLRPATSGLRGRDGTRSGIALIRDAQGAVT